MFFTVFRASGATHALQSAATRACAAHGVPLSFSAMALRTSAGLMAVSATDPKREKRCDR